MGIFSVLWCFAGEVHPHLHLVSPPLCVRVELTSLLEDPTFSVGMICRFVWGAVNLTEFVKNFV